jgi:HAMP domain-containing protein
MKIAQENAIYLRALIKAKGIKTIQELASDPDIQALGKHTWYGKEYVWIAGVFGDRDWRLLVHPLGSEVFKKHVDHDLKWYDKYPDLRPVLEGSARGGTATQNCGYYTFGEVYGSPAKKYLCNVPVGIELLDEDTGQMIPIMTGAGAYLDSYFKDITASEQLPGKTISDEIITYVNSAKDSVKASFSKAVSQINMYLAIAIVVILVIAGIATYLVAVVVSNPLIDLAKSAERIGKGEINVEIPHRGRDDEIGVLAESMEGMRRSLEIASETMKEM